MPPLHSYIICGDSAASWVTMDASGKSLNFDPPAPAHPHGLMVVVCEKAMGARLSDLRDQICGHIHPQAPQWAPTEHC